MPWTSHGLLRVGIKKESNKSQLLQAMLAFCKLIDPTEARAFHPAFFAEVILEKSKKSLQNSIVVSELLENSYQTALQKHRDSKSPYAPPVRILFRPCEGSYDLCWRDSREGGVTLNLRIDGRSRPSIIIEGQSKEVVEKMCLETGIRQPQFFGNPLPAPQPQTLRSQPLDWRTIKVPLGEVLDLLEKYRTV